MQKTRKLVLLALFITLATALHVLEGLLPNPFPLPGIKLGLANIVTLLAICLFGLRTGLAISLCRVLFGSLLGGTMLSVAFLLSLAGAFFSTLVMGLLVKYVPSLSIFGVSMAGAVTHNAGQLAAASLLISTPYLFYYLPVLLLAGLPAGIATGAAAQLLLRYLREIPV